MNLSESKQTHLIAIAGPSCAGKTELAKALARALPAAIVPLDAYYLDLGHLPFEERIKFNFDIPDTIEYGLFAKQIRALAAGEAVERPIYDFIAHTPSGQTERVEPGQPVIVEGLFALYWADLRPLFTTKVFVEAPDEVCLARRQLRDVRERGRTVEWVLRQYTETVRPMAERYVLPTRQFADIVVSGEAPLQFSVAAVISHITGLSKTLLSATVK